MTKYCYDYPRPCVTVDIMVLCNNKSEKKILLIQRKNEPFKNMWALPGGFVDIDEELDVAAKRELLEETGIKIDKIYQFETIGTIGRDPRARTISIIYFAFVDNADSLTLKASDDAKSVKWFNINQLPELAFDHKVIINMAINRLFSKKIITTQPGI